jgi:hypothetical protein
VGGGEDVVSHYFDVQMLSTCTILDHDQTLYDPCNGAGI